MVCWTSYCDPFLTLLIDYSLVLGLLVSSAFNTDILFVLCSVLSDLGLVVL